MISGGGIDLGFRMSFRFVICVEVEVAYTTTTLVVQQHQK
jgi:hypothetical protein